MRVPRLFLLLLGAGIAAACTSTITTPVGKAILRARTTTLRVGDTVTIQGGVLYDNGRFEPFPQPRYSSQDNNVASVEAVSGLIRGLSPGSVRIVVTVMNLGQSDTLFTVTP